MQGFKRVGCILYKKIRYKILLRIKMFEENDFEYG